MNGLICLAMLQEVNNIPCWVFFVVVCFFKVSVSDLKQLPKHNIQRINWIFVDYVQLKEILMRT